jgi:ribosomal protein S18 acetylase RimI-like enzyme
VAAPIEVFRADGQDAPGVAAVHARAWEAQYRELFPELADAAPSLDDRMNRWSELLGGDHEKAYTLIAERGGKVVGFCSLATPSRDGEPGERVAEIAAFYVDPQRWRGGIGTALVKQAVKELREERWQSVTLWVLADNTAARTFYAKFGFQHDGVEGPDQLTDRPKVRLRAKL